MRLATNVSITNNVLAPAEHHFVGFASLYVDGNAPHTLIQNNTFINMSRSSWGVPIATGKTRSSHWQLLAARLLLHSRQHSCTMLLAMFCCAISSA